MTSDYDRNSNKRQAPTLIRPRHKRTKFIAYILVACLLAFSSPRPARANNPIVEVLSSDVAEYAYILSKAGQILVPAVGFAALELFKNKIISIKRIPDKNKIAIAFYFNNEGIRGFLGQAMWITGALGGVLALSDITAVFQLPAILGFATGSFIIHNAIANRMIKHFDTRSKHVPNEVFRGLINTGIHQLDNPTRLTIPNDAAYQFDHLVRSHDDSGKMSIETFRISPGTTLNVTTYYEFLEIKDAAGNPRTELINKLKDNFIRNNWNEDVLLIHESKIYHELLQKWRHGFAHDQMIVPQNESLKIRADSGEEFTIPGGSRIRFKKQTYYQFEAQRTADDSGNKVFVQIRTDDLNHQCKFDHGILNPNKPWEAALPKKVTWTDNRGASQSLPKGTSLLFYENAYRTTRPVQPWKHFFFDNGMHTRADISTRSLFTKLGAVAFGTWVGFSLYNTATMFAQSAEINFRPFFGFAFPEMAGFTIGGYFGYTFLSNFERLIGAPFALYERLGFNNAGGNRHVSANSRLFQPKRLWVHKLANWYRHGWNPKTPARAGSAKAKCGGFFASLLPATRIAGMTKVSAGILAGGIASYQLGSYLRHLPAKIIHMFIKDSYIGIDEAFFTLSYNAVPEKWRKIAPSPEEIMSMRAFDHEQFMRDYPSYMRKNAPYHLGPDPRDDSDDSYAGAIPENSALPYDYNQMPDQLDRHELVMASQLNGLMSSLIAHHTELAELDPAVLANVNFEDVLKTYPELRILATGQLILHLWATAVYMAYYSDMIDKAGNVETLKAYARDIAIHSGMDESVLEKIDIPLSNRLDQAKAQAHQFLSDHLVYVSTHQYLKHIHELDHQSVSIDFPGAEQYRALRSQK